MNALNLLAPYRVVPVVVIEQLQQAVPLARTLLQAGIGVIELTLRTEQALDAMRRIAEEVPEMLIGAGSVLDPLQMQAVQAAGARFAVSPGSTKPLLSAADALQFPYVPGAGTPSEMMALRDQGYRLLKLFPAEASGGRAMLKSVAGPIADLQFMPTGGITPDSAPEYLALDNVSGVGGTWIAPPDLLRAGDFDEIGRRARAAAEL